MNKVGIVLGVAAIATLAGCKDPNYKHNAPKAQDEVKQVEAEPAAEAQPAEAKSAEPEVQVTEAKTEEKKPAEAQQPEVKPVEPEPEYTVYIVQRGDYLAKISKKFNVTINSIKKLNNLKSDTVRLGQKLKLPGKLDVGEQTVPAGAKAAPAKSADKTVKPYTGATKEYVVKNGDTLGKIAYSNGINIRQLKELNGLSGDMVRVGQKLKVPAEKVAAAKSDAKPAAAKNATAKTAEKNKAAEKKDGKEAVTFTASVEKPAVAAKADDAAKTDDAEPEVAEPAPVEEKAATETPAPAAGNNPTHVVQEGEDVIGIAVRFNVSPAEIRELNGIADGDEVKAGQTIKLPTDAQQD